MSHFQHDHPYLCWAGLPWLLKGPRLTLALTWLHHQTQKPLSAKDACLSGIKGIFPACVAASLFGNISPPIQVVVPSLSSANCRPLSKLPTNLGVSRVEQTPGQPTTSAREREKKKFYSSHSAMVCVKIMRKWKKTNLDRDQSYGRNVAGVWLKRMGQWIYFRQLPQRAEFHNLCLPR